jgi:hypothetical protein
MIKSGYRVNNDGSEPGGLGWPTGNGHGESCGEGMVEGKYRTT